MLIYLILKGHDHRYRDSDTRLGQDSFTDTDFFSEFTTKTDPELPELMLTLARRRCQSPHEVLLKLKHLQVISYIIHTIFGKGFAHQKSIFVENCTQTMFVGFFFSLTCANGHC